MSRLVLPWPGIALTITMFDHAVAGPILALGGAIMGPWLGIPLAMVAFSVLVVALVWSALVASRQLDPTIQARIDEMVQRASQRRFIGRFVRQVGDDHPVATAIVAMIVSPVFAVLLARLIHPGQRLRRTVVISAAAYGIFFSVTYATGGSVIASLF